MWPSVHGAAVLNSSERGPYTHMGHEGTLSGAATFHVDSVYAQNRNRYFASMLTALALDQVTINATPPGCPARSPGMSTVYRVLENVVLAQLPDSPLNATGELRWVAQATQTGASITSASDY